MKNTLDTAMPSSSVTAHANASLLRRGMIAGIATALARSSHAGFLNLVQSISSGDERGHLSIVLVDITGSINSADWALYEQSYQQLLKSTRAGDRVVLARIGSEPASRFMALADRSIALKNVRLEDENAVRHAKVALSEDFARIRGEAAKPQNATLILDAISASAQLFTQARANNQDLTLLVLSDMVEESTVANFARVPPDDASSRRIIEVRRSQGLLPDLHGVKTFVVGASGKNAEQMMRIQRFWGAYFAACNASLQDYGRTVPSISW